jgi:hypothetical protein
MRRRRNRIYNGYKCRVYRVDDNGIEIPYEIPVPKETFIGSAPIEILEMVKKATEGYFNSERFKKRKALSRPGDPELFD